MKYEDKKGILDNVFYNQGKQEYDYELCIMSKKDDEVKATKWRKYSELCFDTEDTKNRWFIEKVNNRTILPNEVVLDLEDPELYDAVLAEIEANSLYYEAYKTGSRGYHFHLFYNRSLTETEKTEIIKKYGCDLQKAGDRCMIALELENHWKTGKPKELIKKNTGINRLFKKVEDKPEKLITLMNRFSPVPYANMLFDKTVFVYDKNKQFWRYDQKEGIWKNDADQFIKTTLRKELMGEEQQKKYYTEEVIAYVKDINYKEDFKFNNNPYLIPFKNKIFDLKKDKFVEFSPEHYITNKLDIELNGNTECPNIDKFLADCLNETHKVILYEIAAYTLFTDYPYQKLFFIYGPPSTGKSKYLQLLEKFIGRQNCAMVEPQDMQKDKHAMYKMWLKLANIVSDINYDALDNVNQIKKLTGGDSVDIRKMYNEGFSETLYTKQIFSTNKLPAVKEKTMAWYRRIYPVEFANIVKEKDLFLLEKLTKKEELEGFAYKCLEYLRNLYKNNFIFTYDIDEDKIPSLYEQLSNPVLMFIEENCVEKQGEFVFNYELKERLNNWLKSQHFPSMTNTQINQYMRERFNESRRTAVFSSSSIRVWTGLRWKTDKDNCNLPNLPNFTTLTKKYNIYRRSLSTPLKQVNSVSSIIQQNPIVKPIDTEPIYKAREDIPEFLNQNGRILGPFTSGCTIIMHNPQIEKILLNDGKIEDVKTKL